jgi:hypothetical protein
VAAYVGGTFCNPCLRSGPSGLDPRESGAPGGSRTPDPLLRRHRDKNHISSVWCRLHQNNRHSFSLNCTQCCTQNMEPAWQYTIPELGTAPSNYASLSTPKLRAEMALPALDLTRPRKIAPNGSLRLFERIVERLLTAKCAWGCSFLFRSVDFGKFLLPVGLMLNQNPLKRGALL